MFASSLVDTNWRAQWRATRGHDTRQGCQFYDMNPKQAADKQQTSSKQAANKQQTSNKHSAIAATCENTINYFIQKLIVFSSYCSSRCPLIRTHCSSPDTEVDEGFTSKTSSSPRRGDSDGGGISAGVQTRSVPQVTAAPCL